MWTVINIALLLLSLGVSTSCHSLTTVGPCLVDREKVTFDCSRRNLRSVPSYIWPNVTVLDLSENHLHLTHAEDLKDLQRLIKLNLSGNYLPLLVTQQFYPLPALEVLDISGCGLGRIRTGALQNFPRLNKLFISNNNLQTPVSDLLKDDGWIEIVDLSGGQVQVRTRNTADSGPYGNNKIPFRRKLLTLGIKSATNTSNDTADSSKAVVKRPADSWKYLVAVLVTAVGLSAFVAIVAKFQLIHRYLASYRHSRLGEADGASQCDASNFEVEFTTRRTSRYAQGAGEMMEEDDDGFIEDNYIPTGDRERAEREAEHWQDKQDEEEEEEEEEEIEFSIA